MGGQTFRALNLKFDSKIAFVCRMMCEIFRATLFARHHETSHAPYHNVTLSITEIYLVYERTFLGIDN